MGGGASCSEAATARTNSMSVSGPSCNEWDNAMARSASSCSWAPGGADRWINLAGARRSAVPGTIESAAALPMLGAMGDCALLPKVFDTGAQKGGTTGTRSAAAARWSGTLAPSVSRGAVPRRSRPGSAGRLRSCPEKLEDRRLRRRGGGLVLWGLVVKSSSAEPATATSRSVSSCSLAPGEADWWINAAAARRSAAVAPKSAAADAAAADPPKRIPEALLDLALLRFRWKVSWPTASREEGVMSMTHSAPCGLRHCCLQAQRAPRPRQ
mmetsp:Transcript_19781/g.68640  ORF Transcript_19781/g.68640 Transcript_19781/m.68640 type:complete len:269 (+) Transcript_19781:1894-2700(+)